jgi:hypothetical protein
MARLRLGAARAGITAPTTPNVTQPTMALRLVIMAISFHDMRNGRLGFSLDPTSSLPADPP